MIKNFTIFVLERSFTQWRFSEHMKSSFDNPAEKFPVKLRKNFAESTKTNKLQQFQKNSLETSSGMDNYSFDNIFKLFRSKLENKKTITLFHKSNFPWNVHLDGHVNCTFDNLPGKTLSDNQKNSHKVLKTIETKASSENVFVKTSFWIHRTQFPQRAWSPSNKSPKVFARNRKALRWRQQF